MAIQIDKYQPRQSTPTARTPLPDPGTASLLAREGAIGAQNASQALLHTYQNNQQLNMQQQHLDVQLARTRYQSNVAYQADDARLTFDADAYDFLRDAEVAYKNNPNELLRASQDFIQRRATELASSRFDPQTQSTLPRFENDPDATHAVRGELLQRGQGFLDKANALVTKLTIDNHVAMLERSQETGIANIRASRTPEEAAAAISDVVTSFTNASGTVLAPDKAYEGARKFQDKGWNEFYQQQAQMNPQALIDRLAIGKPEMRTKEGDAELSSLTYRTMVTNPDKVSEVTARNALQLGVITVDNYKAILKAKGFDDDAIKDRTYSARLSEIEQGKVSPTALPEAVEQWAAQDGLDRPRINELRQAVLNHAERVTKLKDDEEKRQEKIAKQNGELVESKVYELINTGKVKTIDEIRPLLQSSLESKSLTAQRKNEIETIAKNMLDAGGKGDGLKANKFELDIRMNALSHSPESIRKDKTLNLIEMNKLIALQETELAKDKMPAHQKTVYDQERRNVGILYGDKGPMAQYNNEEAKTLVAAYQRYDDLVFKHKLNPADAFQRLHEELLPVGMGPGTARMYSGITIPPPADVAKYADLLARQQPLPPGITPSLVAEWVENYRHQKLTGDFGQRYLKATPKPQPKPEAK